MRVELFITFYCPIFNVCSVYSDIFCFISCVGPLGFLSFFLSSFVEICQFCWSFQRTSVLFYSFSLLFFHFNFLDFCSYLYYFFLSSCFGFILFFFGGGRGFLRDKLVISLSFSSFLMLVLQISFSSLLYLCPTHFDRVYFHVHSVK